MQRYPVEITVSEQQRKNNRRAFRRLRLKYTGKRDGLYCYTGNLTGSQYQRALAHCDRYRLRLTLNNNYGQRGNTYRKQFFQANSPVWRRYYFCAYCGRLVPLEQLTVDHLYPIARARRDVRLQQKLKRKGVLNINDTANLVPACRSCNSKKGVKMGSRILKGKLGRHPWYWKVRHTLRIILIILLCALFILRPQVINLDMLKYILNKK